MKILLLLYLVLALYSETIRRAPALLWTRCWHAVLLRRYLRLPWRLAWHKACRRFT